MATALDFAALMKAEKERMRREARRKGGGGAGGAASGAAAARHGGDDEPAEGAGGAAQGHGAAAAGGATSDAKSGSGSGGTRGAVSSTEFPDVKFTRRAPLSLDEFEVGAPVLPSVQYIPDFVTEDEERELLHSTYLAAAPWHPLRTRRLQMYGGTPEVSGMVAEELPPFMRACAAALVEAGVFDKDQPPNHALLNEYEPGQGIMPHKDGPLYHPVVAILSLAASCALEFWPSPAEARNGDAPIASVLCRPRSLLVFSQRAYTDVYHSIQERKEDAVTECTVNRRALGLEIGQVVPRDGTRVSFTIRRVPNVVAAPTDGSGAQREVPLTAEAGDEARRRHAQMLRSISSDGVADAPVAADRSGTGHTSSAVPLEGAPRATVIVRGPAGAGKSTVSAAVVAGLRAAGRRVAYIEQDHVCNTVLGGDTHGDVHVAMLLSMCRAAAAAGFDVVLEGILNINRYRPLVEAVIEEAGGPSSAVLAYLDVPLDETKRRHLGRAKAAEFGVDKLDDWWASAQPARLPGELLVGAASSAEATAAALLQRVREAGTV